MLSSKNNLTIFLVAASVCLALSLVGSALGQGACFAPNALNFTSERGALWVNGNSFKLKGASWFGFETSVNAPHGLSSVSYTSLLDFMANNNFNAIRLPFHLKLAIDDAQPNGINYWVNPDLQGLTSLQVMDKIIKAAADRGLLIMLDLHSFGPDSFSWDSMWYNNDNPEAKVIGGWLKILTRYQNQWNVIAADLKNEPYSATWGSGNANTDWDRAAARIGNAIAASVSSRFLIFVEGTAGQPSASDGCFYGENLIGARNNPVALTNPWKLVYSPHVYGPHVYFQSYFGASNFPANMPAIWDTHFGYVPSVTGNAVVIGEWGGIFSGLEVTWMNALVSYLKSKGMTDQFFWCLNPNSGDTGGLLADDWTTPVTGKLKLLSDLVSAPTKFSVNSAGQVCVSGAVAASSASPSTSRAPSASPSTSRVPSASPSTSRVPAPASASPSTSRVPAPASASPSSSRIPAPASASPSTSRAPSASASASRAPPAAPASASSSRAPPAPASASNSPAAAAVLPPAAPSTAPFGQFNFLSGISGWWVPVLVPGSSHVKIDCGNGQGFKTMSPGWMPHLWTHTPTNGVACKTNMQFIVDDGEPQAVTAPI